MSLLGTGPKETAYVCPDCGSASLEYSLLTGGNATCKACGWMGAKDRLLAVPFSGTSSSDELFSAMRNDLRGIISINAGDFIRFLVKWGVVDAVQRGEHVEVTNKAQVLRYINVIAQAVLMSVMTERQKIEKERANGG